MVCTACGTPVAAGVNFCPRCGAQVAAAAPFPQPPVYAAPPLVYGMPYVPRLRVQRSLQTLGVLWCVYAAYRVIAALIGMFVLRLFTLRSFGGPEWPLGHEFGRGAPTWLAALIPVLAAVTVVSVALSLFTGWSLLNRKPWGRTLAIIAAILALLKFPLGTALGIYTLWVMVPAESGMEWEAIADRS